MTETKTLIVDDEQDMTDLLSMLMKKSGHRPLIANCGMEALEIIRAEDPDVMLLDIKMPDMDGMQVMRRAKEITPDLPVIIITAYAEVKGAIEAMRAGVHDYIAKPFDHHEIERVVRWALSERKLKRKISTMSEHIGESFNLNRMMGNSSQINELAVKVAQVAKSDFTVIISGETGSGKELVARAIHHFSHRSSGPFVAIDCGAIPESLLESEMFGHEKGAFTGAIATHPGKFESAKNGTLLLDEISNMTLGAQAKLLRALQDKVIYRVGAVDSFEVDVRVLVSCNQELAESAEQSTFRPDLYYRLNDFTIRVPALRERKEDIPYLANRFLETTNIELGKSVSGFSDNAMDALLNFSWTGNVRQLRATVRRAVLLANQEIKQEHLDISQQDRVIKTTKASIQPLYQSRYPWEDTTLKEIVLQETMAIERNVISKALRYTGGNKAKAARLLHIDYKTIHTKVKNLGIVIN